MITTQIHRHTQISAWQIYYCIVVLHTLRGIKLEQYNTIRIRQKDTVYLVGAGACSLMQGYPHILCQRIVKKYRPPSVLLLYWLLTVLLCRLEPLTVSYNLGSSVVWDHQSRLGPPLVLLGNWNHTWCCCEGWELLCCCCEGQLMYMGVVKARTTTSVVVDNETTHAASVEACTNHQ